MTIYWEIVKKSDKLEIKKSKTCEKRDKEWQTTKKINKKWETTKKKKKSCKLVKKIVPKLQTSEIKVQKVNLSHKYLQTSPKKTSKCTKDRITKF